ncbi:MAG: DUF421 domain-containing protein [Psychrobacter sp.]|nr:DUF421 domain-containing protein [Psychrobacter sp.]
MDWARILIHDTTWTFAAEIAIRAIMMFILIIVFLRVTGKRGVRQLSIFELTMILGLGSIAGDPMFTEDLPIIQAVIIMTTVISLYRIFTWLMMKFQPFEDLLEGKSLYIVEDGQLVLDKIAEGKMSHDEFFSELRQKGVEHLGQVRTGLLETDGNFSMLLFEEDDVRYGLPLYPKQYQAVTKVEAGQCYACMYCGHIEAIEVANQLCPRCQNDCRQWAQAMNTKFIG